MAVFSGAAVGSNGAGAYALRLAVAAGAKAGLYTCCVAFMLFWVGLSEVTSKLFIAALVVAGSEERVAAAAAFCSAAYPLSDAWPCTFIRPLWNACLAALLHQNWQLERSVHVMQ